MCTSSLYFLKRSMATDNTSENCGFSLGPPSMKVSTIALTWSPFLATDVNYSNSKTWSKSRPCVNAVFGSCLRLWMVIYNCPAYEISGWHLEDVVWISHATLTLGTNVCFEATTKSGSGSRTSYSMFLTSSGRQVATDIQNGTFALLSIDTTNTDSGSNKVAMSWRKVLLANVKSAPTCFLRRLLTAF